MAGIYVHIPYCKRKCVYCDFYSTPAMGDVEEYVGCVVRECAARREAVLGNERVSTLYVGGGTPSLLSTGQMHRLLDGLRSCADLSGVEELTVEVNPDDVTSELMDCFASEGVNRVSMGVQSFVDSELEFMGRRHNAAEAIEAIGTMRRAGIANVSIDLIYGVPGQTMESWRHSVEQAIATGAQHISAYSLSYEPGTRLWVMRQQGKVRETDDEECVAMYGHLASALKAAGYEHYEISNFAKPGFRSRHNSAYWDFTPYLGLGAAAHSYDGASRSYNPSSIRQYVAAVNECGTAAASEQLQLWERYDEEVMLRLRTADGLDARLLECKYVAEAARQFRRQAQRHIAQGLLRCRDGAYCLTDDGVMMADAVIRDLMWD